MDAKWWYVAVVGIVACIVITSVVMLVVGAMTMGVPMAPIQIAP